MQPFTMTKEEHGDGGVCTAITAAVGHAGQLRHQHDGKTGEVTIYLDDRADLGIVRQTVDNYVPPAPPAKPTYYTTDELDAEVDKANSIADLKAHLKLLHLALDGRVEKP